MIYVGIKKRENEKYKKKKEFTKFLKLRFFRSKGNLLHSKMKFYEKDLKSFH